jgi:hypothetical protein
MSCDISHGRLEVCKDVVGGLRNIYIINYGAYDPQADVTYDPALDYTDVITGITLLPSTDIYKFELKGTNSFETTITSSRENGTTFFEQVLSIQLKKQDQITHKQIKLLAYGRPNIIVETNNNDFFIAGLVRGMDVTAGTISNGTALGDMTGYSLTFTGQESVPANWLDCTTEAQLISLLGITSGNVINS